MRLHNCAALFMLLLITLTRKNYFCPGNCTSLGLGDYGFWAFAHIVGMEWVLLKKCNNREEAVTESFPWEFIKPEEKIVHRHCAVISGRGDGVTV